MEVYFGGAEEQDISDEEMAAVRAMVMAVAAGKVFFQSKVVMEKMQACGREDGENADDSECPPGCCD